MGDILWKWKSEIRTLGPYYCPQVNVQYWASKLFRVWILNNPLLAVLAGMFWSNVCKSNQGSWPGLSQEEASSVATIATHSVLGSSVERGSIALVGQLVTVQSLLRSNITRTIWTHFRQLKSMYQVSPFHHQTAWRLKSESLQWRSLFSDDCFYLNLFGSFFIFA